MEKEYLLTVVIPAYNREKTIKKTLDSLVIQAYKNFEVIVSDDGSTDQTLEVVNLYKDKLNLKIIKEENSGGPARPRNLAIKQSTTPWIAFLDSDDWWYENKISEMLPYLEKYDVLFHDLDIVTTQNVITKKVKGRNLEENALLSLLTKGNAIANSSVVVRKECIIDAGFLDESKDMVAVEDYDLWLKLATLKKRFKYISLTLGAYLLEEGNNITQKNERQIKRYEAVVNKHINSLTAKDQKKAIAILSYSRARIYHSLGMSSLAASNYFKALDSSVVNIKAKAFAGIILITLKRFRKVF